MLAKYKKVGKVLSIGMVAVLSLSLLAACGKKEETKVCKSQMINLKSHNCQGTKLGIKLGTT